MKSALIHSPFSAKNMVRASYKTLGTAIAIAATMAGEFAVIFLIHKLP